MVAGDYGTGKTLLCLKLLQYMEKCHVQPVVYVPSSGFSFSMVLEKNCKKTGCAVQCIQYRRISAIYI